MDCDQRHQKSQPFQFIAKGFATGLPCLIFLACSHKTALPVGIQEAVTNNPTAPALDQTALGIQLTKLGSNEAPFLAADGKKIVFISRKRTDHQQGQVYLYDLEALKERRITYQDGECQSPLLRDDEVIYASTTDELKERPRLFQKNQPKPPYPPTELYQSDLTDLSIQRLTSHPGFDGYPWPRVDRPDSILFSQWNGKNLEVHQLNLKNKSSIPLLKKKDRSIEFLRQSPNAKRWAWVERLADSSTQVVISPAGFQSSRQKILELPAGDYKDLIWISDDQLVMAAKNLKKFYQLYVFDFTENCLKTLLESKSDLGFPQVNLEKKILVFTSSSDENSQIFYKSLPTPGQCLKWESEKQTEK